MAASSYRPYRAEGEEPVGTPGDGRIADGQTGSCLRGERENRWEELVRGWANLGLTAR